VIRKTFSMLILVGLLVVAVQLLQGLARVNDYLAEEAAREAAGHGRAAP